MFPSASTSIAVGLGSISLLEGGAEYRYIAFWLLDGILIILPSSSAIQMLSSLSNAIPNGREDGNSMADSNLRALVSNRSTSALLGEVIQIIPLLSIVIPKIVSFV